MEVCRIYPQAMEVRLWSFTTAIYLHNGSNVECTMQIGSLVDMEVALQKRFNIVGYYPDTITLQEITAVMFEVKSGFLKH